MGRKPCYVRIECTPENYRFIIENHVFGQPEYRRFTAESLTWGLHERYAMDVSCAYFRQFIKEHMSRGTLYQYMDGYSTGRQRPPAVISYVTAAATSVRTLKSSASGLRYTAGNS